MLINTGNLVNINKIPPSRFFTGSAEDRRGHLRAAVLGPLHGGRSHLPGPGRGQWGPPAAAAVRPSRPSLLACQHVLGLRPGVPPVPHPVVAHGGHLGLRGQRRPVLAHGGAAVPRLRLGGHPVRLPFLQALHEALARLRGSGHPQGASRWVCEQQGFVYRMTTGLSCALSGRVLTPQSLLGFVGAFCAYASIRNRSAIFNIRGCDVRCGIGGSTDLTRRRLGALW